MLKFFSAIILPIFLVGIISCETNRPDGTTKIGRLIRVDVVFQASKSNDPSPRKTGLDSLVLANVDGVWKVLSFIIHYESKL